MNTDFYRIRRLPPYIFEEVNRLKAQARGRGEDIIDFGMGNPDMPTPQHIVDKLVETAPDPRLRVYSGRRSHPARSGDLARALFERNRPCHASLGAIACRFGGELSLEPDRAGRRSGFLQGGRRLREKARNLGAFRSRLRR